MAVHGSAGGVRPDLTSYMGSLDATGRPPDLTNAAMRTAVVLAFLAAALFLWYTAKVLLLVFAGVLFSIVLDFLADKLAGAIRIGRGWAFAVVVSGFCLLLTIAGWVAVPQVSDPLSQLIGSLPDGMERLQDYVETRPWGHTAMQYVPDLPASSNLTSRLTLVLKDALYGLAAIAMVAILGVYVGASPRVYHRAVLKLFPAECRETVRLVLAHAADHGDAEIGGGASVTLLFLGIHAAEGYLLTPLVQKRAVYLSPALTITSQVLLGFLLGFLGLALATPLTAAAVVLVKTALSSRAPGAPYLSRLCR